MTSRPERKVDSALLRFAIVGALGFVVDVATLYVVVLTTDVSWLVGRLVSYLAAASSTWLMNRHYTFTDARRSHWFGQWLAFLAVNGVGGAINYAAFSLVILLLPEQLWVPVLGVMIGSISGLLFNYASSRRWIFPVDKEKTEVT